MNENLFVLLLSFIETQGINKNSIGFINMIKEKIIDYNSIEKLGSEKIKECELYIRDLSNSIDLNGIFDIEDKLTFIKESIHLLIELNKLSEILNVSYFTIHELLAKYIIEKIIIGDI